MKGIRRRYTQHHPVNERNQGKVPEHAEDTTRLVQSSDVDEANRQDSAFRSHYAEQKRGNKIQDSTLQSHNAEQKKKKKTHLEVAQDFAGIAVERRAFHLDEHGQHLQADTHKFCKARQPLCLERNLVRLVR